FTSHCLYCDVFDLMSKYHFKLDSRRFIQELFLQTLKFHELWEEPLRIFCSTENVSSTRIVIERPADDDEPLSTV
uniref:Uncharacterized protein n=1 Tax=Plectus sambesii TaxID=2011161 RepID=A0A914X0D4_9BILA